MKKIFLFVFLFLMFIIPQEVKGEVYYFNESEYEYSDFEIEESYDVEVEKDYEFGFLRYKYRYRKFIEIPDEFVVYSKDVDPKSYLYTNIPLEEIDVILYYDLDTMNHCESSIDFIYQGTVMSKKVLIEKAEYLIIPEVIIINDYDFDIYSYMNTNFKKDEIKIKGEYDLKKNNIYELVISASDIERKVSLVVNISKNDVKEPIVTEPVTNITNNYTENKYISEYYPKETIKIVETPLKIEPITLPKIIHCKSDITWFYYSTCAFYVIFLILMSIFVVRKK